MEAFAGVRVARDVLEGYCVTLLASFGANEEAARACARALAEASSRGVDTHGVRLLPLYVQWIKAGRLRTDAVIKFERRAPSLGVVDAGGGFGHPASYRAVDEAMALAAEAGVGCVAVHSTSHHGATGTYALHGARKGFVVLGFTQSGPGVVLHQGRQAFNGTNPIAFAVPLENEDPMLLDMATSSIPLNRIYLRRDTGVPLPPDVAVDAEGAMTTDANRAEALLPLGGVEYGYKGAGLATMVELLCTMFTGTPAAISLPSFNDVSRGAPSPLGHFFMAIDGARYRGLSALTEASTGLVSRLRSSEPRAGASVLAPGDPEKAEKASRDRDGIPVDNATWQRLAELAAEKSVAVPAV